ncbi:WD repeat-containing protein 18 isoform X2 [Oncorhynchus mykiss]|uniref:WD repeat-containing protein 18 isoform X2 n=1 Tax=Oncorhynchus mykiss TaxID=8022 RepID=UPI0018781027|nr:WD repeat-containing protein 18 isoform X2 [Oncorhynchus mykiss]
MSAPMEIVLSADSAGQLWNCAVLELHSGTNLLAYRGGNTSSRSLTVLNGEYILGAQLGKNFINVWEIQRKDQLQQKIVCPGIVTCLTASPNGLYLVAGIADAIYLWEVSSGNLLAILSRHYQDLTCLRFSDDSSHFISGGKDNLALVWSLASVVQLDPSHTPEPRHVLSRHSLPITDIHCGLMGPQARVATASLDQTVKSLSRDKTFQSDNEGNQVFKGHRNLVTCLSVSMDGTLLLSGSHDETIRLWDIQSKQSVRSINHKGPVTNALIIPAPANMFLPDSRPGIPLPRFSRHLNPSEQGEGVETGGVCLRLAPHTQAQKETYLEKADKLYSIMSAVTDKSVFGDGENTKVRVSELEEEVRTLKKVNKDLYDFSTQLLTKPS